MNGELDLTYKYETELSQNPVEILRTVFGYDDFRPLQAKVVNSVLNKKDCLVIMPTGGGKSICYQLPAMVFKGLTIVVSPLISLMSDQVNQLTELGIQAAFLNSSLSQIEYSTVLQDLAAGKIKLLYVAPETLVKPYVYERLARLGIDCLAIDEAHCVSEWGHDFRPEYRQIASLRSALGEPTCIALTATATNRVQADIVKNLQLKNSETFLSSFDRSNLFLKVEPKNNTKKQILNFIQNQGDQPGIVYCFSRKKTENLCKYLVDNGIEALPYHAGLSAEDRNKHQDLFIKDKIQVIVATIAFGMGINKSNVRFVAHAGLSKNLESYYQEIGRAGRDSLNSQCLLLYSAGDMGKISHFIDQKQNEKEKRLAFARLEGMVRYAEVHSCRRKALLAYFDEEYKGKCTMCDNCLEPKELVNTTLLAQKLLSCAYRVGQNFGGAYVIDVLRGSKSARVLQNGHDQLSTYGIGKDLSVSQWKNLLRQFINDKLVFPDPERYNVLTITQKGSEVLKGKVSINGVMPKDSSSKKSRPEISSTDYDLELYEVLRKKRTELAEQAGLPPYVIFSDKTLIEMAVFLPQNSTEFLTIHGVGEKKLETYGDIFLELIRDYKGSE